MATAAGHGTLEGLVTLVGEVVPGPTLIRNTTDPEACGSSHSLEDLVVSRDNLGIRHAIVALADVPAERVPTSAPERLVLDNVDCSFSPHASVLTVGSTIEAVNSDPILHTVHVYGALEANLSLPVEGARRTRVLDRPGMLIVKCDVHAWMQAFIRVDEHPFHAVSDSRGAFRIADVPAGSYTLEAWHESLGSQARRVEIEAGKTTYLELRYSVMDR